MQTAADDTRELFQQHGPAVYRFVLMMLHHHQDAEDVVQETFLKLLNHLSARGNTDNLRGWLFTVAAHAARDRQRRRLRWMPWSAAAERSVDPSELPDEDGSLKAARAAMLRLSGRDRMLLALRANGLSYRDIAAATGIKETSVGRLLARALERWAKFTDDARACASTNSIAGRIL